MSQTPPFFLETASGVSFAEASEVAVQIASLPAMPYAEFVFNGLVFKVVKGQTAATLRLEYDTRRQLDKVS